MTALRLEPVIEVLDDEAFDLWPVVGREGFWRRPPHDTMTDAEVGTAVHQIMRWFHTDENDNVAASLTAYLDGAPAPHDPDGVQPIAMGGLRFTDAGTGNTVLPGCCYPVDERFEIVDVLDGVATWAATRAQRHASQPSDAGAHALECRRSPTREW